MARLLLTTFLGRSYALGGLVALGGFVILGDPNRETTAIGVPMSRPAVVPGTASPGQAVNATEHLAVVDRLHEPNIVAVKSTRRLHLFDGKRFVKSYRVGLGFGDEGRKRLVGDGCTPEGVFHVVVRKRDGRFGRFLGINYPNHDAVDWGMRAGLLSLGEVLVLRRALETGHMPNWTTDLGGGIGIHGGGADTDWTAGCLALDDADAEELFDVMRIGDRVEILP